MFRRRAVEADPGDVVMYRWYLLWTPWLTICLHKILKSDYWDLHNHEYDSISLILRGRYWESVARFGWYGFLTYKRTAWRPWFRSADEFHRITVMAPVWTLFFIFNRRGKDFPVGYMQGHKFMPLDEYDRSKGRTKPAEQLA